VVTAAYTLPRGMAEQGDEISASDAQARLEAFRALVPMNLSVVADNDLDNALHGMNLSPDAEKALRADLSNTISSPQADPAPPKMAASTQANPVQAQAQAKRIQLVWITLWDTDVEDGDVVRIESQGYSRTVRLTKKGDTFAVPVPADGVIKVTGVSDGDGGGITVGLASGNEKAIFPIMSEGQQLGLRVRVN
jgi:hypothetical protein